MEAQGTGGGLIQLGETITFGGLRGRLPLWRHGPLRRIWAWLKGVDLEDHSRKQFVVTHSVSAPPMWAPVRYVTREEFAEEFPYVDEG